MKIPLTQRLAGASARNPKKVVAAWVVLFLAAFVLMGALLNDALSTEVEFVNSPDSQVSRELIEGSSLLDDQFTETVTISNPELTVDDPAFQAFAEDVIGKLNAVESVEGTKDFWSSGDPAFVSADRSVTLIPVALPIDKKDDVVETLEIVEEANENTQGFVLTESGRPTLDHDFNEQAEKDLARGELAIGLPIAIIILVIIFGALVASTLPLIVAGLSIFIALGIVALLGLQFEFSFFVQNLVTTMGLAVGIDYSLFIVSRFREERAAGKEKMAAIEAAGGTSSKAVLFSGITVVISLSGLLLVPNTIFISLGAGAIIVVLVAILQALTLLPALLSLMGDNIDRLKLPFVKTRVGMDAAQNGVFPRVARTVMRNPAVFLVVTVALLLVAASPLLGLKTGFTGVSSLPDSFESKKGFNALAENFDAGQSSPVQIVIEGNATDDPVVGTAVETLRQYIAQSDGLGEAEAVVVSDDGEISLLQAPVASDPQTQAAYSVVKDLRVEVDKTFDGTGVNAVVGGVSAQDVDFIDQLSTFTVPVIALILFISLVLLLLAFRSLVIALISIAVTLLAVGAAYGILVLVFQEGVGNEFFGFTQVENIEPWIPLFLFALLFGLSMDYQVFLVSRIQERFGQTGDNRDAIAWSVGTTARLITGAAAIMVAVFGGFAIGELAPLQQFGFGLAVAIAIDALVVRTILVPALMTLLDKYNWYIPSWLMWLPDLKIEGESLDEARSQKLGAR